jgi:RNA polymerase sigma-70 factor (ECF subfamily)
MGVNDEAIWRKHSGELVRFASVLVGSGDAEDLLSTVVVRLLSARGSLEELDNPRPYLFRAVVNEAKNHRRRSKRVPRMTEDQYSVELRPEVLDAVMGLPPQQRAAVYLTYWRDLPIVETADLLGCRPGTVKRYLFLARNRLKETLSDAQD